jgi:hypothetical protein
LTPGADRLVVGQRMMRKQLLTLEECAETIGG